MVLNWKTEHQSKDVEEGTVEELQHLLTLHKSFIPTSASQIPKEDDIADSTLIRALFFRRRDDGQFKTHPGIPPEKRGRRHRNRIIYDLNEFRHWWKTSRLLVRLAGGLVAVENPSNWDTMNHLKSWKHRQAKKALQLVKIIGRGGPVTLFLAQVHLFTRTIRLILAIARAWEARVDNRLMEVGFAEAFAFMGNRCSRYWSRDLTDWITKVVLFPVMTLFMRNWHWNFVTLRPVIITMGFIRAILPFAVSFQGSRFGRQVTFSTFHRANFRWQPVQHISEFHEKQGVYQDTEPDPDLLKMIRNVAEVIGHGADPGETRRKLTNIGFRIVGTGSGGYAVYVKSPRLVRYVLHLTPYGPSILGEMPRFVYLERKSIAKQSNGISTSKIILGSIPPEAVISGFTYSGSYFKAQEWAALKIRFDRELQSYANACRKMGTVGTLGLLGPPTDLVSLKTFVRSGNEAYKRHKDNVKFRQINRLVHKISQVLEKYQNQNEAPKQVILYLEGLDCAGKSSTGRLISEVLEQCGYQIKVAQHNQPPTWEQRKKAWMDRSRFEHPEDMFSYSSYSLEGIPEYSSVVWDRGPGGDFVYGNLAQLPENEKMSRYHEFISYDHDCCQKGILFLKVFFVSDRDSIASTLGKRLAQKHVAQDLREWLDANSLPHFRSGLEEIEHHIDPTDFVALNKYEENLSRFTEFVRNTETMENPWIVVNTSDRNDARWGILLWFRDRLGKRNDKTIPDELSFKEWIVLEPKSTFVPIRVVLQMLLLAVLAYGYAHKTWHVGWMDLITGD